MAKGKIKSRKLEILDRAKEKNVRQTICEGSSSGTVEDFDAAKFCSVIAISCSDLQVFVTNTVVINVRL